jgi:cell division protease FtsH
MAGRFNEMAGLIDGEIKRIVEEAHIKATQILSENIDELHAIAKALLEYETLSGDEIKAIIKGEAIRVPDPNAAEKKSAMRSSLPSSRTKKLDGEEASSTTS